MCKKWNISYVDLGKLIEKYSLVTFIANNEDFLNDLSIKVCVEEIKKYIEKCGGSINDTI